MRSFALLLAALPAVAAAQSPSNERTDVLVEPARTNRAALFSAELEQLGDAAARWLERGHRGRFSVVPRAPLDAPSCAAPMRDEDVIRARHGRIARLRVSADCYGEPPCTLRVRVSRPPDGDGAWETLAEWEAPVPRAHGLAPWRAALARLRTPPPDPPGDLLGALGVAEDRPRVELSWLRASGRWRSEPALADLRAAAQGALDACHAEGWSHAGTEHVVLELDRSGAPARCDAQLDRQPIEPRAACVCDALGALELGEGAAGRRLELGLMNRPSSTVPAGDRAVGVRFRMSVMEDGFRAYPGFESVQRSVASCFAETGRVQRTSAPLTVVVDARGTPTAIGFDGRGLPTPLVLCVERALAPMRFTCPEDGASATWRGAIVAYSQAR